MSTEEKACPFCSANSDRCTTVHAFYVGVDGDPIDTANRLFDALRPTLTAISATYDGAEKSAFWQVVIGRFVSTVVKIVGLSAARRLMQLAGRLVESQAQFQPAGRPN